MTGPCPVCGSALREAFRATVVQRHEAISDVCEACGFLRVRAPHWLGEACADPIAVTDTGLPARNRIHVLSRQPLPTSRIDFALRLIALYAAAMRTLRTPRTIADHDLMVERLAQASTTGSTDAHRV